MLRLAGAGIAAIASFNCTEHVQNGRHLPLPAKISVPSPVLGKSRRTQVLLLYDRRNYDQNGAGLGTHRVQRYFVRDFGRLFGPLV